MAPLSIDTVPMNPTVQATEMRSTVSATPAPVSTRDWVTFSEPSLLPLITSARTCPLRALVRNWRPSEVSIRSAA